MRTGIPPQYMKQINGKIEIHIRDMVTPTYSPPPPSPPSGQVNSFKRGIM